MTTPLPDAFAHKVDPWRHQQLALVNTWREPAHACTMEQGTGKTKVILDTAACLYLNRNIAALVVVAPDGVQRGWVKEQIPKHMTDAVPYVAAWFDNRPNRKLRLLLEGCTAQYEGNAPLRIITINYELLLTKRAQEFFFNFVADYPTLLVADESHRIKNPKAKTTIVLSNLRKLAVAARIMTGTPTEGNPLDAYSQYNLLDKGILNQPSFTAFKAHHAQLAGPDNGLMRHIMMRLTAKYGPARARMMAPQIILRDGEGRPLYRNLEELAQKIAPYTTRVLKSECLDLPPKVYQKRYVTLTDTQRNLYNNIRDDYIALYQDRLLTAPLAITRIMRMQQITGGFYPDTESPDDIIQIEDTPPKLRALLDIIDDAAPNTKFLIWARFTAELAMIAARIERHIIGDDEQLAHSHPVARYWGAQSSSARDKDKMRFIEDPQCRFFVSQPSAGGTGLDGLQVASTIIYYSNDLPLRTRLQSEDRAHRGGSERHVSITIIDIEAEDTLDRKIIDDLRAKKSIADTITGDDPTLWI